LTPIDPSQPPDSVLIAAALEGDNDAFGELIKKHRPALLETARRLLGHREEAEDVLQEVFIQAYKHLKNFRGESKLSTWLYAITLNRVRNHLRQRKNRSMISLDGNPDEEINPIELPEKGPAIDEQLARRTEAERIHWAVDRLKPDFRAIFILHYYQYLSLDEVSRRLGKPVGTVKVYLHRARKEVHAILSKVPEKKSPLPSLAAPTPRLRVLL
jgi:RNA polymerase sigma-70 factor, ECF subfamily